MSNSAHRLTEPTALQGVCCGAFLSAVETRVSIERVWMFVLGYLFLGPSTKAAQAQAVSGGTVGSGEVEVPVPNHN